MIETEITIIVNRKSDIDQIKEKIIDQRIQSPVFIYEYDRHFELNFSSDYEQWEFDTAVCDSFPDYDFTSSVDNGGKEIRLKISRYQSEFCTDKWGRRIENPLRETKYLIKKSNDTVEKLNPNIKVLFDSDEQDYYINIINGVNQRTKEKGFLIQNEFRKICSADEADFFTDKLYTTPSEAIHSSYYKIQELVNNDYKTFIKNKKSAIRKQQHIPRKIIREFIKACNENNQEEIFKNIDEKVIFERIEDFKMQISIEGIKQFKKYISSPDQELCNKSFKIRSTWDFTSSKITIGVKYFQIMDDQGSEDHKKQQFERISFELKNNKIKCIIIYG